MKSMVTIRGKESGTKNAKPFKETSVNVKAPLNAPHCPKCGENMHTRNGDEACEHSSCPYCGYKPEKHGAYNPYRYEHDVVTQGIMFSEYRVKGKSRKRMQNVRELEAEADYWIRVWEQEAKEKADAKEGGDDNGGNSD